MASDTPGLRDLARRLIDGESSSHGPSSGAQAGCERFYLQLMRWTGPAGCQALFRRARAVTRPDHPLLDVIGIRSDGEPHIHAIEDSVRSGGEGATVAALEALLNAVLEQLGQLIGEELVAAMVKRAGSDPPRPRGPRPQPGESS